MSILQANEIRALDGEVVYKQGQTIANDSVEHLSQLLAVNPNTKAVVNVLNYHTGLEGGGGVFYWDATKAKSEHNGGTVIDPTAVFPADWNNQTQLGSWFNTSNAGTGCWVRQYDGAVNVKWFGATASYVDHSNKGANDWSAFQSAINTGLSVYVPKGKYRIDSKELLFIKAGQKMFGEGCGSSYFGPTPATTHEGVTDLYFTGTGEKYIKTRRKYRANSSDSQDDPISTGIHISNAGVQLEDLAIILSVDYDNESPSNLGDDWDVGVFVRTVPQVRFKNLRVLGYWRDASIRYDGTQASNLPTFTTPSGVLLPTRASGSAYSGFDQSYGDNVFVQGGKKGLWLAGPDLPSEEGEYYDQVLGSSVSDARGMAGLADFCYQNSTFFSREHHSLIRAADPIQPLNFDSENFDLIPSAIAIDVRGVSVNATQGRRIIFNNTRVRSFEFCHIAIKKGTEIYFNDLHTEPSPSSTVFNTSGEVIDQADYSNETGTYYGPIAVQNIFGDIKRSIHINRINFRLPSKTFFYDVITDRVVAQGGTSSSKVSFSTFGNENLTITEVGSSSRYNSTGAHLFQRNGVNQCTITTNVFEPNNNPDFRLGTSVNPFNAVWGNSFRSSGDLSLGSNGQSNVIAITDDHGTIDRGWSPQTDNTRTLGLLSARWSELRAANGTINTSDGREKQDIVDIPDEVLDAWGDVVWKQYRWIKRVEEKGENARTHFGVIAQQVKQAFANHGLDPFKYSILCYEEWGEQPEIKETLPAEYDNEENEIAPEREVVTQQYKPAGNRYGIRYDHAQAIEAAYQRRRMARLESKLTDLVHGYSAN